MPQAHPTVLTVYLEALVRGQRRTVDLHSAPGPGGRQVSLCEILCRFILIGTERAALPHSWHRRLLWAFFFYSLSFLLVSISTYFSVPAV